MSVESTLISLAGVLIMLFLAGNIYFIKRLVDKVESTSSSATKAWNSITNIVGTVDNMSNQLRDIRTEIKDLRRIEIEVAVIKSQMGLKSLNQDG